MAIAAVLEQHQDAGAVARCRAGQADAFAEVVERHQAAVFGTALRLIGEPDAALEVANTTFYKAYRALDSLDTARPLRPSRCRVSIQPPSPATSRSPTTTISTGSSATIITNASAMSTARLSRSAARAAGRASRRAACSTSGDSLRSIA